LRWHILFGVTWAAVTGGIEDIDMVPVSVALLKRVLAGDGAAGMANILLWPAAPSRTLLPLHGVYYTASRENEAFSARGTRTLTTTLAKKARCLLRRCAGGNLQ